MDQDIAAPFYSTVIMLDNHVPELFNPGVQQHYRALECP